MSAGGSCSTSPGSTERGGTKFAGAGGDGTYSLGLRGSGDRLSRLSRLREVIKIMWVRLRQEYKQVRGAERARAYAQQRDECQRC